jgi:glucose 1-dehydrogenase
VSDLRLAKKVALVTGASKGIGRALAVGVATAGADVVLGYRTDERGASDAAEEVRRLGREALTIRADLARVQDIRELVEAAWSHFGRVHVLFNNAAVTGWAPALDVTEEFWDEVVDTNLKGTFFCAVEVARRMRAAGGGSIVNLSSMIAALGVRNLSCYAASKGGVHALTKQLAVELAPHRIRVNTLVPGPVLVERNLADDPDYDAAWGAVVPLGRAASPADMVGPALFLASEESLYVTGQLLYADGGWSIAGRLPGGHLDGVAERRRGATP